jgi:hypothetical protein
MASFDSSQERTRAEIADYLREFADELDPAGRSTNGGADDATLESSGHETGRANEAATSDDDREQSSGAGEKVTVIAGNDSATINPPRTCTFDVAVDTDSDLLSTGAERRASFTIRWDEEQVEDGDQLGVE